LRREDLENSLRRRSDPARTGDQVASADVAGCARSDITVVEGVHIGELHGVITVLLDVGNAEDNGLGAKVGLQHGVRRIAIWRDDGGVFRGEDFRVKTCAELSTVVKGPFYCEFD